ncbi:MAG: hypothetical protein ACLVBP_11675, partial [Ruminococcus sp.]
VYPRTILSREEDLPNVRAIQEKMKLMPLSNYISGDTYEPPKGSYSEENNYVPVDKVLSMDPVTFFNKANELMVKNSPAAADKEMLEKIAAVNIDLVWNLMLLFLPVMLHEKLENNADRNSAKSLSKRE